MKRAAAIVIVVLTLSIAAGVLRAEETAPVPAVQSVESELSRLNRTLAQMTALVEELLRRQQADLLMQRIQIATRGLTELERSADNARQEVESLARDRARAYRKKSRESSRLPMRSRSPGCPKRPKAGAR